MVDLVAVDDDQAGEQLRVVWELEPAARVVASAELPAFDPAKVDDPRYLDAFLDAVRWGAITNADTRALQAPFRGGIEIEVDPHAKKPRRIFRNGKLVAIPAPCDRHHLSTCGGFGAPILRDVRAGERVRVEQATNHCGCILYGVVEYRHGLRDGLDPTGAGTKPLVVGRFVVDTR